MAFLCAGCGVSVARSANRQPRDAVVRHDVGRQRDRDLGGVGDDLARNLVAARWPRLPQWVIVAGLAGTVAGLALVPLDWFNALTGATKLVAASAFLTAPVFLPD